MSNGSSSRADALLEAMERTRALTLELVARCDDDELCTSYDPDFSPVGWHFGHLAVFEAFWILEQAHGEQAVSEDWRRIFDPRENPKRARGELPSRETLLSFAGEVRARVEARLRAPGVSRSELLEDAYVYGLVLAHEQQHAETIATVLRMRPEPRRKASGFPLPEDRPFVRGAPLEVPAGSFLMGEDDPLVGYDNERRAQEVSLESFRIDRSPITNGEWLSFVEAGGYERPAWWTEEGRGWRARTGVTHPATWRRDGSGWQLQALGGDVPLPLGHPVEGISAHEADAYAAFSGARLPTEAEWERAARLFDRGSHTGLRCGATRACGAESDFVGNVWEWTASTFAPYPGFEPYPYPGYSVPWFDGRHRVMRGGSWATLERIARPAFRNWYEPHLRRMFVGLRLVREG